MCFYSGESLLAYTILYTIRPALIDVQVNIGQCNTSSISLLVCRFGCLSPYVCLSPSVCQPAVPSVSNCHVAFIFVSLTRGNFSTVLLDVLSTVQNENCGHCVSDIYYLLYNLLDYEKQRHCEVVIEPSGHRISVYYGVHTGWVTGVHIGWVTGVHTGWVTGVITLVGSQRDNTY